MIEVAAIIGAAFIILIAFIFYAEYSREVPPVEPKMYEYKINVCVRKEITVKAFSEDDAIRRTLATGLEVETVRRTDDEV